MASAPSTYSGGKQTKYQTVLTLSAADALPWVMPASNQCWQGKYEPGSREIFTLVPSRSSAKGGSGCGNSITAPSWATTILKWTTFGGSAVGHTCYEGLLPGSPSGSSGPTAAYYCLPPVVYP